MLRVIKCDILVAEKMGTLFVTATPIGNLQDITLRASKILSTVQYIACEDTRKTGLLLKSIGASQKPMLISFYEHNEDMRIPNILNLLSNGQDVALVSDSGTPTISDPGFRLVRGAIKRGIKVESIPGPSALIAALASSGLPTDKFIFLGFLPKKEGKRRKMLESVKKGNEGLEATVIFYEAPHRVTKALGDVVAVFGNINIVASRELTKIHEEILRDPALNLIEHFEKAKPKGEFVLLFNTKPKLS